MTALCELLFDNKEWLFSGIGVVILTSLIGVFVWRRRGVSHQTVHSGRNSKITQAGRDIQITNRNSGTESKNE